jgi:hypothetical protein
MRNIWVEDVERRRVCNEMKRLEYCMVVRDLDRIRRGLWLRERGNTMRMRKETLV